ncbi:hypothetical protein Taro_047430 [Colocasia esculenta]|uniref:Uncharacterized protein n=1 Tax=Colocasia esculenta TaxID=4460 RepID=A0A843WW55_COLES|nr:hypothetical protein [Colocasia esculenta]
MIALPLCSCFCWGGGGILPPQGVISKFVVGFHLCCVGFLFGGLLSGLPFLIS